MGVVRVLRAKENIYIIIVGEENVARKLLEGNPWFIKDYSFLVKLWPSYHFLDDIEADRVVYWIQAYGIPKNYYTMKNARNWDLSLVPSSRLKTPLNRGSAAISA
ncbi:hypothetical protein C1H46_030007 [Malus baccata]|uniref:Uncharacterized protein n=1 Tax=Malus baccata TaxID=106549 RepID=A0A540LD62_MALBA|nr:hypothetical protein C1H46_030007 [Malus baccata]